MRLTCSAAKRLCPEPTCTGKAQEISFYQLYLKAHTKGLVLQGQKRAQGQAQPLALATCSDAESYTTASDCQKHALVLKKREKTIVLFCFTSQSIPESAFTISSDTTRGHQKIKILSG